MEARSILFVALFSLFSVFFLTGYPILSWQKLKVPILTGLAFCLGSGMLIQFLIFLILQRLNLMWLPAIALILIGFYFFLKDLSKGNKPFESDLPKEVYPGLIAIIIFYASALIVEPIGGWDPTAIWFLSAKMVYSAGTLGLDAGWLDSSLNSSFHTDYPKLFAAVTGVCMKILGRWDEYLPKLGFLFLLIPGWLWLASFYQRKFSFLFLILVFLSVTGNSFWGGYLDGYLVFYFGLTILLAARYLRTCAPIDLYSALAAASIMTNLKNEGIVMGLALAAGTIFIFRPKLKKMWVGTLVFVPAGVWFLLKHFWKLQNYLGQIHSDPTHSFSARVIDPASLRLIFDALVLKNHPVRDAVLITILLKVILRFGFKLKAGATKQVQLWICFTASFYFICLFTVYLATPFDLGWHLSTSVDRTSLPFELAAYLIAFMSIASVDRETPLVLKRSD